MQFKTGDVVILKSGGQALTVASVDETEVQCVWLGEEGDLFRETLPAGVLALAELDTDEDSEDDEHEDSEDESDADDEETDDAEKSDSSERQVA